jgi:hypothetical protein
MLGIRSTFTSWRSGVISSAAAAVVLAGFLTIGYAPPAEALPSYARQTGQPCGTCHTDFAGLTPYGRLFKIQGYTAGGGQYRSTLFPSSDDAGKSDQKPYAPPLSMMTVVGFTNTATTITPPAAAAPFNGNNNIALSSVNFMYGGAITDHIGAFAQVSYNGQPAGGFSGGSPYGHSWTWDNTDIRFADSTRFGGLNVTYGITANNNPTVQDPWNTTPAWAFPYVSSPFGAGLGPTPIIDGGFAQQVVSAGTYAFVENALYLEASVYTSLNPSALIDLGADPLGAPGRLGGAAPYWRVAYEPHWGNSWLEVGTFGMYAPVRPWAQLSPNMTLAPGDTTTLPQTDKYTDLGFDTQYQYQGSNYWVTLRGSYIYENQKLDASFANGISTNPTDVLNEARAYASLAYGNNNRVVLTGQYFTSWGTPDLGLYGGSPNTKGWIAEIAYIPFISNFSPGWPWFNARIGLQYTAYTEFNGTAVGASANNSLYLYVWLAM